MEKHIIVDRRSQVDNLSEGFVRDFIDNEFENFKIKKNSLSISSTDYTKGGDDYHLSKSRSMTCAQLSKLATPMLGDEYEVIRGHVIFSDNTKTTHSVVRHKIKKYIVDYSLSQFESMAILPPDYSKFKPLVTNFVDGFFHLRYKNKRTQDFNYRFPPTSVRNIMKKYPQIDVFKAFIEMEQELINA